MPKPAAPALDPRWDAVVLHYTGNEAGEPSVDGVPARDLSANDLQRIVYGRLRANHDPAQGAPLPDITDVTADQLAALRDELAATPVYASTPVTPAEPEV